MEGRVRNNRSFCFSPVDGSFDEESSAIAKQCEHQDAYRGAKSELTKAIASSLDPPRFTPVGGLVRDETSQEPPTARVDDEQISHGLSSLLCYLDNAIPVGHQRIPLPQPRPILLRHCKSSIGMNESSQHENIQSYSQALPKPDGRVRRGIPSSSSSTGIAKLGASSTMACPSNEEGRMRAGVLHERFSGCSYDHSKPLSSSTQAGNGCDPDLMSYLDHTSISVSSDRVQPPSLSPPYYASGNQRDLAQNELMVMLHSSISPSVNSSLTASPRFNPNEQNTYFAPYPNGAQGMLDQVLISHQQGASHLKANGGLRVSNEDFKVRGGKITGSRVSLDQHASDSVDVKVHNGERSGTRSRPSSRAHGLDDFEPTLRASYNGSHDLHGSKASLSPLDFQGSERGRMHVDDVGTAPPSNSLTSHNLKSASSFASHLGQQQALLSIRTSNVDDGMNAPLSPRRSPMHRQYSLPWGTYSYGLATSLSSIKSFGSMSKKFSPERDSGKLMDSLGQTSFQEEMEVEIDQEIGQGEEARMSMTRDKESQISLIEYAETMVYHQQQKTSAQHHAIHSTTGSLPYHHMASSMGLYEVSSFE